MTGPWTASTYAGQWAAGAAATEAARIEDGFQLALSALSSIEDRVAELSPDSARVRALGLEVLPRGYYVAHCIGMLRREFSSSRPHRRSIRRARNQAEEVRALLENILQLTATVDIVGELDLPLELVGVSQSGARAGIAGITRLLAALDEFEIGVPAHPTTGGPQPSPAARWLLGVAGLLLPAGSRTRYTEEFSSELRALVEGGASPRAQTAHALRQVGALWALRRALPPGPARSGPHSRVRARGHTVRRMPLRTRLHYRLRDWFDDQVGSWEADSEIGAQVRAHRTMQWSPQPGRRAGSPAHARDVRRSRIPVRKRLRRR